MFSWAKELLSPSVQTGKPVSADSRKKSKETEGEVTEDGFVCIGKSSFYQSPEMPAIPQPYNYNSPNQYQQQSSSSQIPPSPYNVGPTTLYPLLPHQTPASGVNAVADNHEFIRRIPFNVRSGSKSGPGGLRQQKPYEIYLTQFRSQSKDRYEYDFGFERGIILETNQLPSGCY